MSIINSQPLIGASGQGGAYNLTRSLRFRSSASAYLNRTPSSTGNRRTWTWSAWVKRGSLGVYQPLFTSSETLGSNNNANEISITSSNTLNVFGFASITGTIMDVNTTQVFRDPSAWYHIVVAIDTPQATASNRVKVYVNGTQVTAFGTATYPSQNYDLWTNVNNMGNYLGRWGGSGSGYLDGYMAEVNHIDGQALDASSFGETDTATGVWKPKKYTGTYGTNGFYLKFDNITSTSTLGNDSSGNGNNWTVNNISLTSGATYDSMKDVPTLTDADTANYCVLNVLGASQPVTVSNANLTVSCGNGSTYGNIIGSMAIPSSGKYYFEAVCTSNAAQATWGLQSNPGSGTNRFEWYSGTIYYNGTSTSGATYATNDVLALAIDVDGGTIYTYKNGTLQNTVSYNISALTLFPYFGTGFANTIVAYNVNFGQRPFAYTPPSGFKALNTFNLPTPTIGATASTQANKYFDVKTYTGTGSSLNITGLGFQPDLVWIKERNAAADHALYDAVRGVQKQLESNTTTAETTETTGLTAFNSDGFTVGALAQVNTNTDTYVAWAWDANGAGSSNTAGTITSTVSANTSAGFSIVTYTGNGVSNATVGHGLGVAPKLVILKARTTNSTSNNWWVNHASLSSGNNLYLNLGDAQFAVSGTTSGGLGTLSSTTFTLSNGASNNNNVNQNSGTFVAYCFAEVAGYSKFGSYTGNGSTDGTFVFTGFRPRYLLVKRTDTTSQWSIWDTARNTINAAGSNLWADSSEAETTSTSYDVDFLSNGFKLRNSNAARNANGGTYIFAAFADTPFKYSLGR